MAPQVGFEPTTDRLTADSSTTELLWINLLNMYLLSSTNIIIATTVNFSRGKVKKLANIYTKLI